MQDKFNLTLEQNRFLARKDINMKKLTLILLSVSLASCILPTKKIQEFNEYTNIYSGMEKNIPSRVYFMSIARAYSQSMQQKQYPNQNINILNPQDTQFSKCLQTALDNHFFQPALSKAVKAYVENASDKEKNSDKAVIYNPYAIKINALFADLLKTYTQEISNAEKQQHYDKNIKLYHEYSAKFRETSIAYGDSLFSPSYYHYFDEQSELSQALLKQVELCQGAE